MYDKTPRYQRKPGNDGDESGKVPHAWTFRRPSVSRAESRKKPRDSRMNDRLDYAVQCPGPSRYCPSLEPDQTNLHTRE